ncbi:MAG: hypothetical protein AAF772_01235, partial [Acidobacteriota bacterium]
MSHDRSASDKETTRLRKDDPPPSEGWTWPRAAAIDPEQLWFDHPHVDDFEPPRIDPPMLLVEKSPAFLTDVPIGGVLQQQADDDDGDDGDTRDDSSTTRERGRVVQVGDCLIDAIFAFNVHKRQANGDYARTGTVRWSKLRPEFTMTSLGRLEARIKVQRIAPDPGTLTVTVTRTGANLPLPNATRTAAGSASAVLTALAQMPPILIEPPALQPNDDPVTETLRATVRWQPNGGDPCEMVEEIQLTWNHHVKTPGGIELPAWYKKRPKTTTVRRGTTVVPDPDGGAKHVVPIEVFWLVSDPSGCCNQDDTDYAIIQFVRHSWRLSEQPRQDGRDDWNLDILESEVQNSPRDPTFTHNPGSGAPTAPPVVYPTPNGAGSTSIVQIDRPGMGDALYDRFLEAGGVFQWTFHAFLVCVVEA